jgi:hypothetical protein
MDGFAYRLQFTVTKLWPLFEDRIRPTLLATLPKQDLENYVKTAATILSCYQLPRNVDCEVMLESCDRRSNITIAMAAHQSTLAAKQAHSLVRV